MFHSSPGSATIRAGWASDLRPQISLPPVVAKYRERKLNRNYVFVGSDIYSDGTSRGSARNVYEPGSNVINNWDVVEWIMDYIFIKMGVDGDEGRVNRPVVMTEPVANLNYSRKSMSISQVLTTC